MTLRMTAGELATRPAIVAHGDDSLAEAARRMREHHVGCLVVVEPREAGQAVTGLLTDRDIVVTVTARDVEARLMRVADVMSRTPLTAQEEEPVLDTLAAMRRRGVRRVPVVDRHGLLAGILSLDDILEAVAGHLHSVVAALRSGRHEARARP